MIIQFDKNIFRKNNAILSSHESVKKYLYDIRKYLLKEDYHYYFIVLYNSIMRLYNYFGMRKDFKKR